ncbi:MAG TPA: glycine cleavage system protein H [Spirochaetota bacterium]|nr:glycine cleavage system protein H [Spirochaetota bacterium]HPG52215.1 glycine cleavage system protein H [Spirochaetota bacterium]
MNSIPDARKYTSSHMWIEMEDEFIARCGIADKYLYKMDIIEFVDFPDVDIVVRMGEKVGIAESDKDIFEIHSPVSGRIVELNKLLEKDPSLINSDTYGEGWIYKIDVKEPNELRDLMHEDQYYEFLERGGDI